MSSTKDAGKRADACRVRPPPPLLRSHYVLLGEAARRVAADRGFTREVLGARVT